ncbi:MAG: phosphatase PAP2 family protein [Armatimonadota bacterium]
MDKRINLIILLLIISVSAPVYAGTFSDKVGDFTFPAIGIAAAFPAMEGSDGLAEAARRCDGVLVALSVTGLLKESVHEWRPDRSDDKSFPSGHTAAAFALAGTLSEEYPKDKWLYYGLAALIGWSRVDSDKHHWHDVAAGAVIGYASGKWSAGSSDGILIGKVFRW